MKYIPYIVALILLIIILLQNKSCKTSPVKETRDTVIVYIHIHDTVPGKTIYIKSEPDTVWLTKTEYKPDSTYNGLLKQYTFLGNNYFEKRLFNTTFQIADYGTVSVTDTIRENKLIGSSLITELNIPVTTITVEKESPPKTRLYFGISVTGTKTFPIRGIYGDGLLKTKNERIYGFGVGYDGELVYKGTLLWPLRFK